MSNTIGELEAQLALATSPQEKIESMNALAWALRECDTQRAIALSEEASSLSQQGQFATTPYHQGLAYSLSHLGYLNHYKADYSLALSQSFDALSLFEHLDQLEGVPMTLSIIGLTYLRLGNYSDAFSYQQRALKIAKEISDVVSEAKSLNGI